MKTLNNLTKKEMDILTACARAKCVDCERACYSEIGLLWNDWSAFANSIYDIDKMTALTKDR